MIPQIEPLITQNIIDHVCNQIKSGWVGTSAATEQFENMICDITKFKYCISTTSGTMAIYLGMNSINIKKPKILFPAYTFLAGANVCKHLKYDVELIDVDENTLCMNPKLLPDDDSIGAVMFVNHNGYVGSDLGLIKNYCINKSIPMIEDCSQSFGINNSGKTGDFGVFSFSVPKLITTGQGGCLVTDNEEIAIKCRKLRDHGDNWRKTKVHNDIGINLKFNDILASYGIAQLKNINELLAIRKQIFDWYRRDIHLVDFGMDSTWMVIYRTKKAQSIINELKNNDIQATQYYRPVCDNPPYASSNTYPVSRKLFDELVYLPSSLNLTESIITKITTIIKGIENE